MTNDKTVTMSRELAPCPFCGGEPVLKQYRADGLEIKCSSCHSGRQQRWMYKGRDWLEAKMIEQWNTRTASDAECQPELMVSLSDHKKGLAAYAEHIERLKKQLAAPVVERQEPVARFNIYASTHHTTSWGEPCVVAELHVKQDLDGEWVRFKDIPPPAPVAVVMSDDDLTEIAQKAAVASTHRYAYMPAHADSAKYFKPHRWVIDAMRACLDKVKEMNQ